MSRTTVTAERDLWDYGLTADIISLLSIYGNSDGDSDLTVEDAIDPSTGRPATHIDYHISGYVPLEQGERFVRRNGFA